MSLLDEPQCAQPALEINSLAVEHETYLSLWSPSPVIPGIVLQPTILYKNYSFAIRSNSALHMGHHVLNYLSFWQHRILQGISCYFVALFKVSEAVLWLASHVFISIASAREIRLICAGSNVGNIE